MRAKRWRRLRGFGRDSNLAYPGQAGSGDNAAGSLALETVLELGVQLVLILALLLRAPPGPPAIRNPGANRVTAPLGLLVDNSEQPASCSEVLARPSQVARRRPRPLLTAASRNWTFHERPRQLRSSLSVAPRWY